MQRSMENIQKLLWVLYFCFQEDLFIPLPDSLVLSFIQPACPTPAPCISPYCSHLPKTRLLFGHTNTSLLTHPQLQGSTKSRCPGMIWIPPWKWSEVANCSSALEKVTKFERAMCWNLLCNTHQVWCLTYDLRSLYAFMSLNYHKAWLEEGVRRQIHWSLSSHGGISRNPLYLGM